MHGVSLTRSYPAIWRSSTVGRNRLHLFPFCRMLCCLMTLYRPIAWGALLVKSFGVRQPTSCRLCCSFGRQFYAVPVRYVAPRRGVCGRALSGAIIFYIAYAARGRGVRDLTLSVTACAVPAVLLHAFSVRLMRPIGAIIFYFAYAARGRGVRL